LDNPVAFESALRVEAMTFSLSPQSSRARQTKLFVCLPCYNEAQNILQLLPEIHSTFMFPLQPDALDLHSLGIERYHIVAVNDGSTDETEKTLKDFAKTYPLTVISHSHNQGLAETIKTLINALKEQAGPDDIAVFMDADNTHPPHIIKDLVKAVSTTADVAVASRYTGGLEVGVPLRRRILSKTVNWLVRNLCGISVLDCTSGYRAYRCDLFEELPTLKSKGFEITAEILMEISEHRPPFRIEEIPLTLYYDRKKGASKIHVGQTIKAYTNLLRKHGKIDPSILVKRAANEIRHRFS
jgi:dolichol-phosphate mannosyltransferase